MPLPIAVIWVIQPGENKQICLFLSKGHLACESSLLIQIIQARFNLSRKPLILNQGKVGFCICKIFKKCGYIHSKLEITSQVEIWNKNIDQILLTLICIQFKSGKNCDSSSSTLCRYKLHEYLPQRTFRTMGRRWKCSLPLLRNYHFGTGYVGIQLSEYLVSLSLVEERVSSFLKH